MRSLYIQKYFHVSCGHDDHSVDDGEAFVRFRLPAETETSAHQGDLLFRLKETTAKPRVSKEEQRTERELIHGGLNLIRT